MAWVPKPTFPVENLASASFVQPFCSKLMLGGCWGLASPRVLEFNTNVFIAANMIIGVQIRQSVKCR